jgi:hypothetical protein
MSQLFDAIRSLATLLGRRPKSANERNRGNADAFRELREIEPGDRFDGFGPRRKQAAQRASFMNGEMIRSSLASS